MMTGKDLAIATLSITATILLTGVVLLQAMGPAPALAAGQTANSGDFIVTTCNLNAAAELVVVVDAALQRMNVYGFNTAVGQVELIQQIDLTPLQRMPGEPPRRSK